MSHTPFWLDEKHNVFPSLQDSLHADVVVIGGGLCGMSAAYHLHQEGLDTVVLESRTIASGATGRNAGFILQGTAERYNRAITLLGRARARQIHEWSIRNHEMMAATIQEEGIDCDYHQNGSLQLAGSPQEEEGS